MNVGVPFWVSPCTPAESVGLAVGSTAVTVGVYFVVAVAVTSCPSLFWPTGAVNVISTPVAVPLNVRSGWNVTSPVVGLIV